MTTPNELAPRPQGMPSEVPGYPLMENREAMGAVLQLIDENLSGQRFSVLNLSHIKVPSGGAPDFRVDDAAGPESMRSISAIITAFRPARIYWQKAYGSGGGKKPPDCTSIDGFVGIGNPGGDCPRCPYSQFGTSVNPDGTKGNGQACKEVRQMLVLMPEQLLPHILNVPPTSLKNFMQYTMNLISAGVPYWGAITKLTLEPATSAGGVDFARIHFTLERRLDRDHILTLKPYHERMQAFLKPMIVDASIYETSDAAEPAHSEAEPPLVSRPRGYDPNDTDVPF